MNDERSKPDPDATAADDDATREDALDKYDDGVLAADATGMLAGERLITQAEIEAGLEGGEVP
jgi:hypothetical protein